MAARKASKDTSHLFQYLLFYSPGAGEDPASANCSILRHTLPSVAVCLVINVYKCRVGGDKNKCCAVVSEFPKECS